MSTHRRRSPEAYAARLACLWATCAVAVAASGQRAGPSGNDEVLASFQAAEFRDAAGELVRYRLFTPSPLVPGRKYPLLLYLHGLRALGSDNRRQVTGSQELGARVWVDAEFQSRHPCFVLAPQCPLGSVWASPLTRRPSKKLRAVESLIVELSRQLPVDTERLYVTGQSMGGFGTWAMIAAYPDIFAAAAPVCGGGSVRRAEALAKTPVWAFHGTLDPVVLARESRRMVEAIRKAGGNPKYTEFPRTLHNSWKLAYSSPELATWLFEQRRPPR